jgi:hypothetical protein
VGVPERGGARRELPMKSDSLASKFKLSGGIINCKLILHASDV